MKKLCLFLSITLFCFASQAQYVGLDWAYSFGDIGWDLGNAIETDGNGNVYSSGVFEGTIDVDPGPGVTNLVATTGLRNVFIKKDDGNGNLIWAHQIATGGFGDSLSGKIIDVDAAGNLYLAGSFFGTVDFDPGSGTFNLTSAGRGSDLFVLKLSAAGNFLWAKRTGGTNYEQTTAISLDPSGNLFTVGYFYGTIDFDPGTGTANLTANQGGDIFIQKLDPSGDFLWAKKIGNSNYNTSMAAKADDQGNIVLMGVFRGAMDLDPGAGTFTLTSTSGSQDFFTAKLDPSGDLIWATQIGTSENAWRGYTNVDASGNVYVSGSFAGTADFDPGPGTTLITSGSNGSWSDAFIQKLSPQGTLIWVKTMGATGAANYGHMDPSKLGIDDLGNSYLIGFYSGAIDFDPGPGIALSPANNSSNNFVVKISDSGDYLWSKTLESNAYNLVTDYSFDANGNMFMTGGLFGSLDFDPSPGTFTLTSVGQSSDIFIISWGQDSCSNLAAVIDSTLDVTCLNPGFASGFATGGQGSYSYSWNTTPVSTDTFASFTTAGLYEFTVTDSDGCSRTSNFLIGGPTNIMGQDLAVNITSTNFRTGFPATIWLDAFNDGCTPVTGEVRLVLDPFLTYDSSNPAPDTIIGDTLIWYVSNMTFDSPHFMAEVMVTVSTQAMIGDQICLDADISPKTNESNTKNNTRDYCRPVINAYDPNDKQVSPQGLCAEGFITNDEALTYTIRFQNTGNADAINIFILDTISANLDMSSLKVVGQSHKPMITEVLEDRTLKFRFDDIHLPDSNTNEPQSHGYVMFELSPLPNLASGTEIQNTSGIYFDFNEPVITNTVLNTVVDALPSQDTTIVQATGCNSYDLNGRTYSSSGVYLQRLSGTGSCDSLISLQLTLQPLDTSVTLIGTTLTANEGGAHGLNTNYQWVDCDNGNMEIAGATEQNFTPTNNGNYAVIIGRDNCSEMSACINVATVGIDPEFQAALSYYPNPTKGTFEIDLGAFYPEIEVEILNAIGQTVNELGFGLSEKVSVQLPNLKGLYFVKVQVEGKSAILKIIKQ